jgi:hypothetical protein
LKASAGFDRLLDPTSLPSFRGKPDTPSAGHAIPLFAAIDLNRKLGETVKRASPRMRVGTWFATSTVPHGVMSRELVRHWRPSQRIPVPGCTRSRFVLILRLAIRRLAFYVRPVKRSG